MRHRLETFVTYFCLIAISSLLVADQFAHRGVPASYDGRIHITNMAMVATGLRDGDFPVAWADGYARYGLPIPLIAQQLPTYLGALFILITRNPQFSYKLVLAFFTLGTTVAMFRWLSHHSSAKAAFAGSLVFTFTAYRIHNIYVRAALPEYAAILFIPLILSALHRLDLKKKRPLLTLCLLETLLVLTHPFIFLLSLPLQWLYGLYIFSSRNNFKVNVQLLFAQVAAFMLSAYYVMPLLFEMKYFVIAKNASQLVTDQFLHLNSFFQERWPYSTPTEVFVRGNIIQFGVPETHIMLIGPILLYILTPHYRKFILAFLLPLMLFYLTMSFSVSLPLYEHLPLLHSIQFPWRMLAIISLIPPIVIALCIDYFPSKLRNWLSLLIITLILCLRIPQSYGKNYVLHPPQYYFNTIHNLYFDSMNTVWSGTVIDYPLRIAPAEIIEGQGQLKVIRYKNSSRTYQTNSSETLRLKDNTFYFPGWRVLVDNQSVPIEFQDVLYRGLITYKVPPGEHHISVYFANTKIRLLGKCISLFSLISFGIAWFAPLTTIFARLPLKLNKRFTLSK